MKKQNGFSQIVIMVVMLILAIALPVTANLVKKVQDNRSSAAINTTAAKSACTTSCKNIINGLNRATLPGQVLTFLTDWKPDSKCSDACGGIVAAVCVAGDVTEDTRKTGCTTTCNAATGLLGKFICNDICTELISLTDCVPAKEGKPLVQRSQCSSTNCAACSTGNECTAQSGCRWGYYNSFLSCVKKDSQPTNPTNPTTPTNPHTEKWQTGAVGSGAKCTAAGGVCGDYTSTPVNGESCMVGGRIENGVIASGLCSGDTTVKCCKPSGSAPAPSTPTGCGAVRNQCDGNNLNHCNENGSWSLVTTCKAGCDGSNNTCKDECTIGQVPVCLSATTRQFCNKDADNGIRLKTENCPNGCTNGVCNDCSDAGNHCLGEAYKAGCTGTKLATDNNCENKANYCAGTYYGTYNGCGDARGCLGTKDCTPVQVCTPGAKQCSDNNAQVCNTDGSAWTNTDCGSLGCNANTKTCNTCTPGTQKCTTSNKYFTCSAGGNWSTTTTDCSGSQICTDGNTGTTVCNNPEYTAPKLNMMFAVHGLKANPACFGNLNFKVSVSKDGSNLSYIGDAVATVVADKFSVKTQDQVLKISDFALPNTFALTDKIKIGITSDRKILTTIYGKDGQNSGYPALDTSDITVSSLNGNILSFYEFPVLNGDIGSSEKIGVKDNMVNSMDWVYMKSQWNNKCDAGKNIESDLNGDCLVNGVDFQILKNAMENQYSQKTF